MNFDMLALISELTVDEGRVSKVYRDTRGNISIGVGRNLSACGVSSDEIDLMLQNDIAESVSALNARWPWWSELPPGAQRVMINMCFNLGAAGLATFVHFLDSMEKADWSGAIAELKNSSWYEEVGRRGPRMCARLAAL